MVEEIMDWVGGFYVFEPSCSDPSVCCGGWDQTQSPKTFVVAVLAETLHTTADYSRTHVEF